LSYEDKIYLNVRVLLKRDHMLFEEKRKAFFFTIKSSDKIIL